VSLFHRRVRPRLGRGVPSVDRAHLEAFVAEHVGVEAFIEPPTAVSATTVVLVASTGEWTRRRVPTAGTAHEWANRLGIPSYDAAVVGYPRRMRDWNSQRSAEQKRRADDVGR
jgi:hypothetical protein